MYIQANLPETISFLSAQMAVLRSFFKVFIVLGMYKFDVEHDSSSERSQIKIRRTDVVSTLVKY